MSNFNFKESIQWRNLFTRSALILITVALIVWLLPRNASQQFHYDIDKPWMYNSFIASFDFPVYKTDEAIQEEKDSLLQYFQPYFNYRTQVEKQQIDRFKNDFKVGIPGLPTVYISRVSSTHLSTIALEKIPQAW